jgi:pyrroline-5-carboxylate reductase
MSDFICDAHRIGLIGAGALGGAVALGLANKGVPLFVSDALPQPRLKVPGIRLTTDNAEVIRDSDVVFFALKVPVTPVVIKSLAPLLEGKLCVSLASSVTLAVLKESAPGARWARAMSSICAALNCAMTGISCSEDISDSEAAWLRDLFSLCGEVDLNPTYDLDVMTSVAGAGPAFIFEMIEAMAMGGIQIGIPKSSA